MNIKEVYDEVKEINGGEIIQFKCKFRKLRQPSHLIGWDDLCSIKSDKCPLVEFKLLSDYGEKSIMDDYGCNGWIALEWTDYIKYKAL
jgi:hypothetical protein